MLLLFRSKETRVPQDRTGEIQGNSRDLRSRPRNSTSFAGSLRHGGFCRVGSSFAKRRRGRFDETRGNRGDRGEEVTRAYSRPVEHAIIRSRHRKYQWRNGSLIPRPAPCQCLSSTSFISFILLFFVISPSSPFPPLVPPPPCPPPRFCGVHTLFLVAGWLYRPRRRLGRSQRNCDSVRRYIYL